MLISAALASAAPRMALAVLLPEIVRDMNLSLVQVGLIWGTETFTGIVASVLGGSLSDRYGARASLVAGCVMAGFFGLARGFAPNYGYLLAASFLVGPFAALIPINLHKAGAQVFPLRQLAISNGGVSVGMALGFVTGAFTAAAYLSPALGGWSNVMRLTGVASMMIGLVWALLPRWTGVASTDPQAGIASLRESIVYVWGIRDVRIICLAVLGYGACVEGMLGYLPLYLREIGWMVNRADLALTTFHIASMAATIPLTLFSDHLRNRQGFLVLGSSLLACATLLVPILPGNSLFAAMLVRRSDARCIYERIHYSLDGKQGGWTAIRRRCPRLGYDWTASGRSPVASCWQLIGHPGSRCAFSALGPVLFPPHLLIPRAEGSSALGNCLLFTQQGPTGTARLNVLRRKKQESQTYRLPQPQTAQSFGIPFGLLY